MSRLHVRWLGYLGCVLVLAGCGGAPHDPNRPKTVPVTGTVTHNGKPVEGATVTFMAQNPQGRGATGRTDEAGRFTLTTFGANDGAIPGEYRVKIAKTLVEGQLSQEQAQQSQEQGKPIPAPVEKDLLPLKYKKAETSGLTASVQADGENDFPFELKN